MSGTTAVALCTAAMIWMVAGCAPPGAGRAAPAPWLYVTDSQDGAVTRLDVATGRPVGPPLPGGPAPRQVVVGAHGTILVRTAAVPGAVPDAGLTFVARRAGRWVARPVALEPGAADALIAGDGGRLAAVAYRRGDPPTPEAAPRCQLALLDLATGAVLRAVPVCGARDSVVGLAVAGPTAAARAAGPSPLAAATVYLAIWRRPEPGEPCGAPAGSRIVAMQLAPERVLALAPASGVPGPLVLASAAGGPGPRLYAAGAEPDAGPRSGEECDQVSYDDRYGLAARGTLTELDAATLDVEGSAAVSQPPRALAVTPDGSHAYLLAGRRALIGIDLTTGTADLSVELPEYSVSLAVAGERLYVPNAFGRGVCVLDRRTGRLLQTLATGRHPLGITLAAGDTD